jgi:hypothetical protein
MHSGLVILMISALVMMLNLPSVSGGGNVISTVSFPLITRPKRGNWYALRPLDEALPSFNTLETDFVSQFITGNTNPSKVLLFLSVETDYNTKNRANLFKRVGEIFASARTHNYFIIFRSFYKQVSFF